MCHGPTKLLLLIDLWGEKGCLKGDFLEIPKIENGTKIDQWRQDRHWETLSRSGFEKTLKVNERHLPISVKIICVRMLGLCGADSMRDPGITLASATLAGKAAEKRKTCLKY